MDRISHLPEPVLHRILCFLSQKEAARTSVLSKAWRHTWSTRSTVEFLYTSFKGTKHEFVTLVNKILQVYRDQNLCIDEFVLEVPKDKYISQHSTSLLNKWIPVVMRMGGITKFHLCILPISNWDRKPYDLPPEVFEAQSLQDISLSNCNLGRIRAPIHNLNLRRLCLELVRVKNETFQEIVSSCPSIVDIRINSCAGFRSLKVNNLQNLRSFSISKNVFPEYHDIEFVETPNLETLLIGGVRHWVLDHNPSFCNLRKLTLRCVTLSSNSLDYFSCNLPSLEKLIVFHCDGFEKFGLCSPALKHFEFSTLTWTSFEMDAPSMLYFQYWGVSVPSLTLTTISSECKSNISINISPLLLNASLWFSQLKKMLDVLGKSEIFLDIRLQNKCERIENALLSVSDQSVEVPPVVVECLHFSTFHSSICSPLLNAFFGILRPMKIEHSWFFFSENAKKVVECLWKSLMEREDIQNETLIKQQSLWQQDLEEVSIETFHESRDKWLPFRGKNWLEYCAMTCTREQGIRFQLKWR